MVTSFKVPSPNPVLLPAPVTGEHRVKSLPFLCIKFYMSGVLIFKMRNALSRNKEKTM